MNIKENCKYTKSHEWVEFLEDGSARVGLSDYAQQELGDLVFVNLPEEGDAVTAGEALGDVESVKAVSDVYSPVTGTVAEVNEALLDSPESINSDPNGSWFVRVEGITAQADLMDAGEYADYLETVKE